MPKKWIIALIMLLMYSSIVSAFQTSSENYNTSLIVVDSGGTNISSENYKSIVAIGQIAYTNASSENYNIQFGIFPYRLLKEIIEITTPTPPSEGGEGGEGGAGGLVSPKEGDLLEENKTFMRYDLLIKLDKSVYEFNETIIATITIDNKGDVPDEDTVLIFWLSNPINKKFGEAREQFLEIPIGKTKFKKEIKLPEYDLPGEWRFNLKYFTSVQPIIEVYQPFMVKEERTFIDTIKDSDIVVLLAVLSMIFIIVFYYKEITEGGENYGQEMYNKR